MPRLANESQQSDWLMPPMLTTVVNSGTGQKPACGPTILAVTTSEVDVDLTSLGGSGAKASVPIGNEDYDPSPVGHYISLEADGDDIYYCFADALALLGSLSKTAVTAIASNQAAAKFTATGVIKLPNGTRHDWKIPVGSPPPGKAHDNADGGVYSPARYLGFFSSALSSNVFLRIWQSSP